MAGPSLSGLTPREREILIRIAEGDSLPEIAQRLHRSLKTIETHRLSLGRKLNASNRVELARIAIATGLVSVGKGEGAPVQVAPPAAPKQTMAERELAWLDQINREVYSVTGPTYIRKLCDAIGRVLGVRFSAVCVSDPDGGASDRFTVALSEHGQTLDPIHYQRAGTPADTAIKRGVCSFADGLAEAYPEERFLRAAGARCYIGVRLDNGRGEPVGVLAVADDKPARQPGAIERVLRFFAPRTASEIEQVSEAEELHLLREKLEEQVADRTAELEAMNKRLREVADFCRTLAEKMQDGLVVLDGQRRITYANQAFAEIAGLERDQVIGRPVEELLTEASRARFLSMPPRREGEADQMHYDSVEIRRPDGTVSSVLVGPRSLLDEQGRLAGSEGVVTGLSRSGQQKEPRTKPA